MSRKIILVNYAANIRLKNPWLQIKTKNWVITYWIKNTCDRFVHIKDKSRSRVAKKNFRIIGPGEKFCLCLKSNPTYYLRIIEYDIVWDSGKENFEVRGELSIYKDKESINILVRFLGFCIVKILKFNM